MSGCTFEMARRRRSKVNDRIDIWLEGDINDPGERWPQTEWLIGCDPSFKDANARVAEILTQLYFHRRGERGKSGI